MAQVGNIIDKVEVPNRISEISNLAPAIKKFAFSKLISSKSRCENFFAPISDKNTIYHGGIGQLAGDLVARLIRLPGVKAITVEPYELHITISEAVDWNLLMPTMIKIMVEVVFPSIAEADVDVQLKEVEQTEESEPDKPEFIDQVSTV